MFKIGDFSRLTRVSIKSLRHYDEIGLFKPTHIDRFTGYRYYTFDQLPRLNRILALKGLGFTLEQIRQQVDGDLNADQLRGMLRLRQAQLAQEAQAALEKLTQVEVRLNQIEQEGIMPQIDILTKSIPSLTIVGAREVVAHPSQMRERCMALNQQACDLIKAANLKTDWVSFALYYSDAENGIDVEMAYVVEPSAKAQVQQLPPVTVAYAVYSGSYDDFGAVGQIHAALAKWIAEHGYRVSAASREFYLRPPSDPNDPNGVMEIQYPIEKI